MLGELSPRENNKTYLNIKDGAIVKRTHNGEERFSFVDGRLENITQRERNFGGEKVRYWYIDLRDTESGELYSLGFHYSANTFKSIILQLASEEGLLAVERGLTIKIEPYKKNGYDKVQVWSDGNRLGWAEKQLPPLKEITIGGRVIKDDSERMGLITAYAREIRKRVNK